MKKFIVATTIFALTACGNAEDNKIEAQKSLMQQAIDNASQFNQICLPYTLKIEYRLAKDNPANTLIGAPQIKLLSRQENGKHVNNEAIKQMQQLVEADLYKPIKTHKQNENNPTQHYLIYQLTEQGKDKIRLSHHGAMLCVGTTQVENINYFTEPTPHRGYTVSQVNYTAKLIPEKWAKNLVRDHKALKEMNNQLERNATLVKTNEGWRDIRELR